MGAFGAFLILLMVFMAVAAPWISGDPNKWHLSDAMSGPSAEYWLGTNDLGQDMWAMIVRGARVSLYVGFLGRGHRLLQRGSDWAVQRVLRREGGHDYPEAHGCSHVHPKR